MFLYCVQSAREIRVKSQGPAPVGPVFYSGRERMKRQKWQMIRLWSLLEAKSDMAGSDSTGRGASTGRDRVTRKELSEELTFE